jgi:fluoroquinolone transport system permease protein
LLLGIVGIGIIYTLIGIVLIVRYDKITEFLIPLSAVAVILQLPFLYFLGWVEHPLFLLIPTSAPTVLMQAAYVQLPGWQWLYALGYTAVLITVLTTWAYRAFQTHISAKGG